MKKVHLAALAALTSIVWSTAALANSHLSDAPMPGKNLWDWITANVLGAFPVILACVSLYYLVRRAFAAFISFAVFAMSVAVFVYAPELVKDFGIALAQLLTRR